MFEMIPYLSVLGGVLGLGAAAVKDARKKDTPIDVLQFMRELQEKRDAPTEGALSVEGMRSLVKAILLEKGQWLEEEVDRRIQLAGEAMEGRFRGVMRDCATASDQHLMHMAQVLCKLQASLVTPEQIQVATLPNQWDEKARKRIKRIAADTDALKHGQDKLFSRLQDQDSNMLALMKEHDGELVQVRSDLAIVQARLDDVMNPKPELQVPRDYAEPNLEEALDYPVADMPLAPEAALKDMPPKLDKAFEVTELPDEEVWNGDKTPVQSVVLLRKDGPYMTVREVGKIDGKDVARVRTIFDPGGKVQRLFLDERLRRTGGAWKGSDNGHLSEDYALNLLDPDA